MSGRVALVTGAGGAIGSAVAERLDREGALVAIQRGRDGRAEPCREGPFLRVQAELAEPGSVDGMFRSIEERLGPVTLLVCAAGPIRYRHWSRLGWEDWEEAFRGNVLTAQNCCRRALPGMRTAGYGRIVLLAYSGASRRGPKRTMLAYAAAKSALLMMSRTMARDLAPEGITVNVVSPGYVATPGIDPDPQARWVGRVPAGRLGAPGEVADAVAFLTGPGAGYVTGADIVVAGGL